MTTKNFDVVIVGAGLSGIGMACHLQKKCPNKSYIILEGRDFIGGTWDLFHYPGIRSDSDMHTLGYNFKPWKEEKAIADGSSILKYIKETAIENNINKKIRFGHFVQKANWSDKDSTWKIEVKQKNTNQIIHIQCKFLLICAGYYSYESGYTPEFNGTELFKGNIIHPQKWPNDLDYRNKKVIVIGSGATAITLVPAMSEDAKHIVMLQRSPTYVVSSPDIDKIANFLRKILPEKIAYSLVRWKNIFLQEFFYKQTRSNPKKIKKFLIDKIRKELGPNYDVEKHFTPNYNPWDQRLCLVTNSDLFKSIKSGKASVVTDQVNTFTKRGILLKSGDELEADIIITATGLKLNILGDIKFFINDKLVELSDTYTYKGMMYSNVPNLISTFGYINASWTLRADLIAEYTCRLVNHMCKKGYLQCTPRLRDNDKNMNRKPWIDNFSSNYVQRAMHLLPNQGDKKPWINSQSYRYDKKLIRHSTIEDDVLEFKE